MYVTRHRTAAQDIIAALHGELTAAAATLTTVQQWLDENESDPALHESVEFQQHEGELLVAEKRIAADFKRLNAEIDRLRYDELSKTP